MVINRIFKEMKKIICNFIFNNNVLLPLTFDEQTRKDMLQLGIEPMPSVLTIEPSKQFYASLSSLNDIAIIESQRMYNVVIVHKNYIYSFSFL